MNEIKNRDYILEAIDQLRRRKARPDIQRICNFMTRRFAVDSKDTKIDLQRCVDKEIVYKVEYKGSISYRNAAKKSYGSLKKEIKENSSLNMSNEIGPSSVIIHTKTDAKFFTSIVITAVADLILGEPDYLEFGVPAVELIKKILSKHANKYNRKSLIDLLQKEVNNGGLIRMENGNFSLGPSSQNDDSEKSDGDDEYITVNTSEELSPPPAKIKKKPGPKPGKKKLELEKMKAVEGQVGIRLGIRRKRAKKVFDPSDNMTPRSNRKRGRPLGSLNKATIEKQQTNALTRSADSSPAPSSAGSSHSHRIPVHTYKPAPGAAREGGVCSVCHLQGKKGTCERMVSCRECSNKAHYECLNTEDGMLRMHPDNSWQCPHCKTCVVCYETSDAGALTVCSICADAYHTLCHEPSITEKSKGAFRWICTNCQMEPLLTEDIKPKIGKHESLDKLGSDKISLGNFSTGVAEEATPTPPNSGHSSPFLRSPAPSPTPPTLSPQTNHNGGTQSTCSTEYKFNASDSPGIKDFDNEDSFDPTIPDASNWSFDDVYNYFAQYFPEEAIVFKEQEIDGHSLLLMTRVDVLTSLNLKLGPALKIYKHVVKLQVRKDDHKLYWL